MTSLKNNEFRNASFQELIILGKYMVELHVLGRKEHFNLFIFGLSTEIIVM